jgi:hypothetical protein
MFGVPQVWWWRSVSKPMHADASHCWLLSHHIQSSTLFLLGMTQASFSGAAALANAERASQLQLAAS